MDMFWLDSIYPADKPASKPCIIRRLCASSEVSSDVENQHPDSSVTFSDIRFGPIDSTY
jgi:cellulose 1,4-beta-cellobiosidase